MAKPIWFPFYPNDFLASTKVSLMDTCEIGAYLLLLCHAWASPDCSLPTDADQLKRLARYSGDFSRILDCFIEKRGKLYNVRLLIEFEKVNHQKDLARNAAHIRWHSGRNASALRPLCSSPSPSPSDKNKEKKPQAASLRTALVDASWIEELKKNPAYGHVNFPIETGKMDAWLALPRNATRKKTRRFVLNWINKIDAPLNVAASRSEEHTSELQS